MEMNVGLLKTSFAVVAPAGDELTEVFYEHLFRDFPEVKPMFAAVDMASQRQKLLASLHLVVENLRRPEVLVPALENMGLHHLDYRTRQQHYSAVGQTLLKSLAQIAGSGWTDELHNAWAEAYDEVVSILLQRAAQPAA